MSAPAAAIRLRAMTGEEFVAYRAAFLREWAADLETAEELTAEQAMAEAAARTDADLTMGVETPGHHLFVVLADEVAVGRVWFSIVRGRAFLDDVTIDEAERGKGYGRRALELCEEDVRQRGGERLELHVYRHNPRAIALYESMGYRATGIKMSKRIGLAAYLP